MTMKLPQKAGSVPTTEEWAQLVRIAENLAAQAVKLRSDLSLARDEYSAADDDAHKWATLANSAANERDAARAEVARLTAALAEYGWHLDGCPAADCSTTKCECGYAALRQPAPAPAQDDARDAMIEILDDDPPLIRWQHEADAERNEPAPAGGEARQ